MDWRRRGGIRGVAWSAEASERGRRTYFRKKPRTLQNHIALDQDMASKVAKHCLALQQIAQTLKHLLRINNPLLSRAASFSSVSFKVETWTHLQILLWTHILHFNFRIGVLPASFASSFSVCFVLMCQACHLPFQQSVNPVRTTADSCLCKSLQIFD